jgi:acetyl esterase/lipase
MSWQLWALDAWLRLSEKPRLARERSVAAARARMEATAARAFRPGSAWREERLRADPALAALRLPASADAGILLWLHGGAYCLGSPFTHADMAGALARRAGTGALLPEYRLAPEHVLPAAVEDALAAWEALRDEGVPPGRIALGGDSAGGGLAFALLHLLLASGAPPPACVVAFSPWVDLTLSGASLARLAWRDAFLPAGRLVEIRDQYLGGADPRDPRASPHLGRFAGAPPVLVQASRAELLRDDARLIAGRLAADGAPVTLDLVRGVPHVWQAFHAGLPEAAAALDRAAAFVARHLKSA